MPYYKDAPYYDAVPNWTGFYLGINGGYGWAAQSSRLNGSAIENTLAAINASSKLSAEGGFGGGQLGYNMQRDRFVFGVEADIEGASIGGRTGTEAFALSRTVITDAWAKSTSTGSVHCAAEPVMPLAARFCMRRAASHTAALRDRLNQAVTSSNPVTPATVYDLAGSSATATGYVVGGGFETAITPSWSFKAEYQYIDLGSTLLSAATASTDLTMSVEWPGAATTVTPPRNSITSTIQYASA